MQGEPIWCVGAGLRRKIDLESSGLEDIERMEGFANEEAGGLFALLAPGPDLAMPAGVPYALPLDPPIPTAEANKRSAKLPTSATVDPAVRSAAFIAPRAALKRRCRFGLVLSV